MGKYLARRVGITHGKVLVFRGRDSDSKEGRVDPSLARSRFLERKDSPVHGEIPIPQREGSALPARGPDPLREGVSPSHDTNGVG